MLMVNYLLLGIWYVKVTSFFFWFTRFPMFYTVDVFADSEASVSECGTIADSWKPAWYMKNNIAKVKNYQ